ncbi:MAG: toast rack family protein [Candidatus Marinimicrobia bacterium]|nr:toast rack family protein [Candidatus Neomarinimicrobiota bacterium]
MINQNRTGVSNMKRRLIIGICLITAIAFAEDIVTERHEVPYKGEEELSVGIEFGLGKLELRSIDNKKYIMQAEITYSKDLYKPEIDYKTVGKRGKLRLASRQSESGRFWGHSKKSSSADIKNNHWRVAMTDQIPTAYNIELGLGKGILDFTNIKVNGLNLECGLSDVLVEFAESNKERIRTLVIQSGLGNVEALGLCNTNMDRFEIECGLGSTKLRFDGDLKRDIKGRITIGLGSVTVQIPKGCAVQIEAESSFLSSLNFDGFREVKENVYRSKNWKNADQRIYIVI